MIPNLTLIVASYVVVRLLSLLAKQFPNVERGLPVRVALATLSVVAIVIISLASVETIVAGTPKLGDAPIRMP